MELTPLEIETRAFPSAFRGYAKQNVDQFLGAVSQTIEQHLEEIQRLKARISELEQSVARYQESEDLLKNSVVLAQRTCDELIAAAHKQADAIKREAESEGKDISRRLGELKAEREQFEYAFHGLLQGFLTRLEQGNPALAAPGTLSLSATAGSNKGSGDEMDANSPETRPDPARDFPQPPLTSVPPVPDVPNVPTPKPQPSEKDLDIKPFAQALQEAQDKAIDEADAGTPEAPDGLPAEQLQPDEDQGEIAGQLRDLSGEAIGDRDGSQEGGGKLPLD